MTTFADVIEDHRVAIGAASVHVSLGPEATPENLAVELERLRRECDLFASFTVEEQLGAQVARLRALLDGIDRMARQGDTDAIISAVDMVPDVDMVDDIRFMAEARRKHDLEVPDGVDVYLVRHEASPRG